MYLGVRIGDGPNRNSVYSEVCNSGLHFRVSLQPKQGRNSSCPEHVQLIAGLWTSRCHTVHLLLYLTLPLLIYYPLVCSYHMQWFPNLPGSQHTCIYFFLADHSVPPSWIYEILQDPNWWYPNLGRYQGFSCLRSCEMMVPIFQVVGAQGNR